MSKRNQSIITSQESQPSGINKNILIEKFLRHEAVVNKYSLNAYEAEFLHALASQCGIKDSYTVWQTVMARDSFQSLAQIKRSIKSLCVKNLIWMDSRPGGKCTFHMNTTQLCQSLVDEKQPSSIGASTKLYQSWVGPKPSSIGAIKNKDLKQIKNKEELASPLREGDLRPQMMDKMKEDGHVI